MENLYPIDYESVQYACEHLRLALAFYDAGRLDTFLRKTGDTLCSNESFVWCSYYDILDSIADFVRIDGSDDDCTSRYYFSDECIREYFALVRTHAARKGVSFRRDPYYLSARQYFYDTMLDDCPYNCYFRLVTQFHHEYGCGLSVWTYDEGFDNFDGLVLGLLDVMGFFQNGVKALRKELRLAEIVQFPDKNRKEAA